MKIKDVIVPDIIQYHSDFSSAGTVYMKAYIENYYIGQFIWDTEIEDFTSARDQWLNSNFSLLVRHLQMPINKSNENIIAPLYAKIAP